MLALVCVGPSLMVGHIAPCFFWLYNCSLSTGIGLARRLLELEVPVTLGLPGLIYFIV